MTYRQVMDFMTRRERFVFTKVMNWMKIGKIGNGNSIVEGSVWNRILYKFSKMLLHGADPWKRLEFYAGLIDDPDMDWEEFEADVVRLSAAYN